MRLQKRRTYGDNLRSDERERSLGHDSGPPKETTLRTRDIIILNKRPWVLPVAEADSVVVWTSTQIQNNAQNEETNDSNDLDGSKNELGFTINA